MTHMLNNNTISEMLSVEYLYNLIGSRNLVVISWETDFFEMSFSQKFKEHYYCFIFNTKKYLSIL